MEHGPGRDGPVRLSVASTGTPAWREATRARSRFFEWGLMAGLVLVVLLTFMHQAQQVQGQAELAAIKRTLGALRTAAVMDDLQARLHGRSGPPGANPFDLLQLRPENYLGPLGAAQAATVRPGSWWFDPQCSCVVYAPLETRWLAGSTGGTWLRFRVVTGEGPLQLAALGTYLWQGQRVD